MEEERKENLEKNDINLDEIQSLEEIENFIDISIETEDFEFLDLLLERRQKFLESADPEVLKTIAEADEKRKLILNEKLKELKTTIENLEKGKQMTKMYYGDDEKGTKLNRMG